MLLLLLLIFSFRMEWVSDFKWPQRFNNVFTYLHLAIELLTFSIYVCKLQTLTCKCGGCLTGFPYSRKRGHEIGQRTSNGTACSKAFVCIHGCFVAIIYINIVVEAPAVKLQTKEIGFYQSASLAICFNTSTQLKLCETTQHKI